MRVLADACLALSQGELAQRHDAYGRDVTLERYLHRCELKTARLFAAACGLGALAAGARAQEVDGAGPVRRAGSASPSRCSTTCSTSAGRPERTGKHRGTDLLEGTTTLPLILAREADPSLAALDLATVDDEQQAEAICDRIAATGALDRARDRATALVAEAKQATLEVDPELRAALDLVADGIVSRYA